MYQALEEVLSVLNKVRTSCLPFFIALLGIPMILQCFPEMLEVQASESIDVYLEEVVRFGSEDGEVEILVTAWHDYAEGTDTYEYVLSNISHCGISTFAVARNDHELVAHATPAGWGGGGPAVEEDRWIWDGSPWARPEPGISIAFQVTIADHVTPVQGRVSIWSGDGCVLRKQDFNAPVPGDPMRIPESPNEVGDMDNLAASTETYETTELYVDDLVLIGSGDCQAQILVKAWHNYADGTDTYEYTLTNIAHCQLNGFAVARSGHDLLGKLTSPGWGDPEVEEDRWGWSLKQWASFGTGSSATFQITIDSHVAPSMGRVSIWATTGCCVPRKQDATAPVPGDPIRLARELSEEQAANDLAAIAASAEIVRSCCTENGCQDLAWSDCADVGGSPGPPGSACSHEGCCHLDLALATLSGRRVETGAEEATLNVELVVENVGSGMCPEGIPVIVEALLQNGLWISLGEPILLPSLDRGVSHVVEADLPLSTSLIASNARWTIRAFVNPLHYLPAFDFESDYSNNLWSAAVNQGASN